MVTENNACDKVRKEVSIMRKLDKRIKKVTDIKTPFSEDFEELSNYIGFNAYGADDANCFHDLDVCFFGALKRVSNESYDSLNFSFTIDNGKPEGAMPFRYMILEKDLEPKEKKEKKYRPLSIDEFLDRFDIGEVIVVRSKSVPHYVYHVLFVGYLENGKNEMNIILGQYRFSLQELFSNYEYDNGDNWLCFGVEE